MDHRQVEQLLDQLDSLGTFLTMMADRRDRLAIDDCWEFTRGHHLGAAAAYRLAADSITDEVRVWRTYVGDAESVSLTPKGEMAMAALDALVTDDAATYALITAMGSSDQDTVVVEWDTEPDVALGAWVPSAWVGMPR